MRSVGQRSVGRRNAVAGERADSFAVRILTWLPFGFVALAVAVGVVLPAWWLDGSRQRAQAYTIATVAELKATEFDAWFAQRLASAGRLATYASLGDLYVAWREHDDLEAHGVLRTRLQQFASGNGFTAMALLDAEGPVVWTAEDLAHEQLVQAHERDDAGGPRVPTTVSYRDARGRLHIDVLTTLAVPAGTPAPLVVCHACPSDLFSPHTSVWPTPEYTGQVVLFHLSGDAVDGLGHISGERHAPPDTWQLSSDDDARLAVRLARGQIAPLTVAEGLDERGERILGAGRAIEGSDWFVLAQVPRELAMAGAARLRAAAAAIAAGAFGASVFGLGWLQQRRRLDAVEAIRRSQAERLHALQLLQHLAASSTDAIFAKDREGRYTLFNDAAARFVGRPAAAVLGRDDTGVFPLTEAARIRAHDQRAVAEERVISVEETLTTTAGERTFLSTRGPLCDDAGRAIGVFGISRDVTDRSRTEAEARAHRVALQRNLEELERFNRAMVGRELAMVALKRQVNALAQRLGEPMPYENVELLDDAPSNPEATDA